MTSKKTATSIARSAEGGGYARSILRDRVLGQFASRRTVRLSNAHAGKPVSELEPSVVEADGVSCCHGGSELEQ